MLIQGHLQIKIRQTGFSTVLKIKQFFFAMDNSLIGKKFKSYKIIKIIGRGQSGTVFEGVNTKNNEPVAIKAIKINVYNSKDSEIVRSKALAQASILKSCNNDNIIRYVDSFEATHFFFFIVTQFCNGGDLSQYLHKNSMEEAEAVVFLKQILNGFNGLHKISIMHRDFKAANVLLNDNVCKIADFGLSKKMGIQMLTATNVGTPLTNAPQVLEGKSYGFQADIWSIGVVYYQMLFQDYPFREAHPEKILEVIKRAQPSYISKNKKISKQSVDFLRKCLKVNPLERISWAQIYKHPLIVGSEVGSNISRSGNGLSKNDINVENNKLFYQQTQLNERKLLKQYQVEDISKTMTKKDIEDLKKSMGTIPNDVFEIVDKFQQLYFAKRDNAMFFYQHVHPLIPKIEFLQLNHNAFGFIFAKKNYIQISELASLVKKKVCLIPNSPDFSQYSSLQNYKSMRNIYQQQKNKAHKICVDYLQNLTYKSLQIKNQQNLSNSSNCSNLLFSLIPEFVRLLKRGLKECEGQQQIDLLKLIRVLEYYDIKKDQVDAFQYDTMIQKEKIQNSSNKYLYRFSNS